MQTNEGKRQKLSGIRVLLMTVAFAPNVGAANRHLFSQNNITNPYFSGCLQQNLEGWKKPRVCIDRHDPPNAREMGLCEESPFDYLEIRIATGNWDSATALGWLTQIVLSEMLGVPSSIESNMYGSSRDFYDPQASIDYDRGMSVQPLVKASELPNGDCRSLPRPTSDENYQACAHFYPEFWGNPIDEVLHQQVEPPQGIGILGYETWFMTKFTADELPELISYHGLQKVENREKVAATFKRPTTWKDYCELVSLDNCTTANEVSQRAPLDDIEAARMFEAGLYTGHFRYTEKNNCTLYPTNCTGHIANYPCGWQSNMESNVYHMKLPLDPNNGPDGGPNGYTADQLKEMWHAANATRSHLMMAWWSPEPLYQQYLGTDAELQKVVLKPYTRECALARVEWKDECAEDLETRVGAPEEACDNPVEPLRKLINAGLRDILESPDIDEETRNPAYDVLRLFQIDEIQLGELFDLWMSEPTPRDAICTWAVENVDILKSFIPTSYPRVTHEDSHLAFGYVAIAFGSFATLVVVLTSCCVYKKQDKDSIQFAQLDFLSLLLIGSFLVALGSILLALPASDGTCIASIWFVNMGYTVELVPLIVKVAAINRVMEAARELRRIRIKRGTLYKASVFIGLGLVVFLGCWTGLDPPQQTAEYSMTGSTTDYGDTVVDKRFYCSGGESNAWQFVAVSWNALLLLSASVLAFQSRNVLQKFNESRTLAFLIYSHFIFVVLRIVTFLLAEDVKGSTLNYARSLIYALDQIGTCVIYFLPKLTALNDDDSRMDGHHISGLSLNVNDNVFFHKNQSSLQSSELRPENRITTEATAKKNSSDPSIAGEVECRAPDESMHGSLDTMEVLESSGVPFNSDADK